MWLFLLSLVLIVYTMVGYPLLLKFLVKHVKKKLIYRNTRFFPTVTCIITAHNEEAVILKKLQNLESCVYPDELLDIIIASDFSEDKTNSIVQKYIDEYKGKRRIHLHQTKEHKGKTNAQNEAVALAKGEIFVFSDANALLDSRSICRLAQAFSDDSIGYVTGKLVYTNAAESTTSNSECNYWDYDLQMRKWESDIGSITAGNGALYAIRRSIYTNIPLTYSHDSYFPPYVVVQGKRAIFDEQAIAYEKAGETNEDEFKRKIRMSRNIFSLNYILPQKYNVVRNGWFTIFYLSHRTFRNNLYLFHIILLLTNIYLVNQSPLFSFILIGQCLVYGCALLGIVWKNPILHMVYYYVLTLCAQLVGVIKEITGQSKPTWGKAESTRK